MYLPKSLWFITLFLQQKREKYGSALDLKTVVIFRNLIRTGAQENSNRSKKSNVNI